MKSVKFARVADAYSFASVGWTSAHKKYIALARRVFNLAERFLSRNVSESAGHYNVGMCV